MATWCPPTSLLRGGVVTWSGARVLEDLEDRLTAEAVEVQTLHHRGVVDAEMLAHPVSGRAWYGPEPVQVLAPQDPGEELVGLRSGPGP